MLDKERNMQLAFPSPKKLFTPAVTVIIILMIVGYALFYYAQGFVLNHLTLSRDGIFSGKIWQLITYSFVNGCGRDLVFNGLVILFVGSMIEREWSTGAFLLFMLVVSVVCGVLWVIINSIAGVNYGGLGTGACGYGLIAAFGVLCYRRLIFTILWTVEAQYLAWFLIAVGIVLGIPRPRTWIWVSGAAVGYVYIKLRLRQTTGPVVRKRRGGGKARGGGFVDID
ncbi:MAG: rhomboid family intramembrane serine protease [Planctomycetota bacterium]|jgi:membrane associated rhomboid family serine protease